jgi:amino acid transporter
MASNNEDRNGAGVFHRPSEGKPPRFWRSWLIGRPLPTADAPHQTVGKTVGLAVFASDALSSTAYATQESLIILAAAGAAALAFAWPISIAIVVLLAIVTLSYEQIIHAYPDGGGAYIVSRDNLGEGAALVAGAALLTDYILTVAVSISSGVAQFTSAFPATFAYRVPISVVLVLFVMTINLRGVRESGAVFAIPSYFFIGMMYLTMGIGIAQYLMGTLGLVQDPPELYAHTVQPLSMFLILHAFSSGTSALTGTEAISNGITAFKEPRSHNAAVTLLLMAAILGSLFLAISFLAVQTHALPSEYETVISQLARTTLGGRGPLYLGVIASTMLILVLAANTSFAGFPRLSAILATDGYLPRQFTYRGSRLVYSRGIIALAAVACLLTFIFDASVTALIPLYAIGVFLSFTLAQAGMARRWWKSGHLKPGQHVKEFGSTLHYEPRWQIKLVSNTLGAISTAVVTVVFAVTKFETGAWIVLFLIPILVYLFSRVRKHYRRLAAQLSLEKYGAPPGIGRHRVILPVSGVHRGTLAALRYARSLSDDITAVHVSLDPLEAERLQDKWELWGDGVRLVILESPFRLMMEPLLTYIEDIASKRLPNEIITVVVPQFVPKHARHRALHYQTADVLRSNLISRQGIVVADVPYQVD